MTRCAGLVAVFCAVGCSRQPQPAAGSAPNATANPAPVRITHFYAGAGRIEANQSVGLCYGVENARAVHLEPPVEQLQPGYNRCFYLTPPRKTTYKLTAEGLDGSTATASVTVDVVAPAPLAKDDHPARHGLFTLTFASANQISSGDTVTICYGAPDAVTVTVDPPVAELKPSARYCLDVRPDRTTTYRFTATSRNQTIETAELPVIVRGSH